jgi:hypothetical protein
MFRIYAVYGKSQVETLRFIHWRDSSRSLEDGLNVITMWVLRVFLEATYIVSTSDRRTGDD